MKGNLIFENRQYNFELSDYLLKIAMSISEKDRWVQIARKQTFRVEESFCGTTEDSIEVNIYVDYLIKAESKNNIGYMMDCQVKCATSCRKT